MLPPLWGEDMGLQQFPHSLPPGQAWKYPALELLHPSQAQKERPTWASQPGRQSVQLLYDGQESQITENVIRKLKNGDMLNEKLSISFSNIDFFIRLKNLHFGHTFFFFHHEKKK